MTHSLVGKGSRTASLEIDRGNHTGTPGKRTLTEGLPPVQRKVGGTAVQGRAGARDETAVHASAERGIAAAAAPLPHLDTIQRAFGRHDISGIRAHVGGEAATSAREMGARAFATGDHVAFAGPPDLHTAAHEAAHVVQQRGGVQLEGGVGETGDVYERHADDVADRVVRGESAEALLGERASSTGQRRSDAVQRDEFEGTAGETVPDEDRPLKTVEGSLPVSDKPGGRIVPKTESKKQNCAGNSLGVEKWIMWPHMGHEAEGVTHEFLTGNWEAAKAFVPAGCTRVSDNGVTINSTRCNPGERELIVFLFRWYAGEWEEDEKDKKATTGKPPRVYDSNYHMVGRPTDSLPSGWHSKMDSRERVEDIRDPLQSLHEAYPHIARESAEIVRLTFCVTGEIKTK